MNNVAEPSVYLDFFLASRGYCDISSVQRKMNAGLFFEVWLDDLVQDGSSRLSNRNTWDLFVLHWHV